MNRFLGPSGYYYGVKPDRTLQKENLLRQLRQRFPHLSLYPHPAYFQPWLSPKNSPSCYAQVPYFPPGLQFPYILLRGQMSKRSRRIRHPFGVFRLRAWRFDPPLYNLRLTHRMRQARFHNVFHRKHTHGKGGHGSGGLQKDLATSQMAAALANRANAGNTKLRAHLFTDPSADPKGQGRLIPLPPDEPFKVDVSPVKLKRHLAVEDLTSDHDDGGNQPPGKHKTKALKGSPESKAAVSSHIKTDRLKSVRVSAPPLKGLLKKPILSRHGKSNAFHANSDREGSPQAAENLAISSNNRIEREALEAIARRKKHERMLEKERNRAEQERRRTEQEYLRALLIKSLKKQKPLAGQRLKRTRSQKRRAIYRKYLEKEKLTPEEEVSVSRRKEWLRHLAVTQGKRKRVKHHTKRFPYGVLPPRFQTTPSATARFFWGSNGPELRNKKNRDKLNVFLRHSEELLLAVRDHASTSDAAGLHGNIKASAAKEVHSTVSQGAHSNKQSTKPQRKVVPSAVDHGSKLLSASSATISETHSSHSDLGKKFSKHVQPTKGAASATSLVPLSSKSDVPTSKDHAKRKIKKKIKCQPAEPVDSITRELEEKAPEIKHPETCLDAREELMRLREKAWRLSVRRQARRKEQRRARIKHDHMERESEVRKITHPVIEKPDRKVGAVSHLSVSAPPALAPSAVSKPSRISIPVEPGILPVTPLSDVFPKARNRREAFRAYLAKHLLRLKAHLVFNHRLTHANKDPLLDRWGRPVKTEIPLFDNKNPCLTKVIKNLMRTKAGYRYKYETRAEEFLTNFPFSEYQTYRAFPITKMTLHDRMKHYTRIKKIYRGQRLFKMMTPVRWYKSVKKNALETPFDFQLYSDAVGKFQRLAKNQNEKDKNGDDPGESYHQFGLYEVVCGHLKMPPFKEFQEQLAHLVAGERRSINLAHENITDAQIRPIAMCIMLSELVDHLDISGNLLGPLGGSYVAGICGHTGQLTELNTSGQRFDASVADLFFRCLRRPYCKIKKLWLSSCNFGPETAHLMAGIIKENRSLILLDLSNNQLASVGNNDMLGLAIAENTSIQELNLAYNGFSEKASYLIFHGATANTSLEVLSYSHNRVGDEGCKAISKMLEASDKMRSLELEHCFLTDVGAKKIGLGIEKNVGSVERLILRDNLISGIGANIILKAVEKKEKLRHVDLSLCPVNTAFVTNVAKSVSGKAETYIEHTGDKPSQPNLPKYEIDFEALALKKAKADAAKKAKKNK